MPVTITGFSVAGGDITVDGDFDGVALNVTLPLADYPQVAAVVDQFKSMLATEAINRAQTLWAARAQTRTRLLTIINDADLITTQAASVPDSPLKTRLLSIAAAIKAEAEAGATDNT